jgi:hypothetical protein
LKEEERLVRKTKGIMLPSLAVALVAVLPALAQNAVAQPSVAQSSRPGQFVRSPARSTQNFNVFLDELAKSNPQGVKAMRDSFKPAALFNAMDIELAKLGFDADNLGDVMSVMWISASRGNAGLDGDPSPATIAAVKAQLAEKIGPGSSIDKLSNVEKQDAADAMLLSVFMFEATAVHLRKQGAEGLVAIKNAARQMAQVSLYADIAKFTVDDRGIQPVNVAQRPNAPAIRTTPQNRPVQNSQNMGGANIGQLKAAHAALPAPLKSAILVKNDYYDGYNNYALEVWMLFPGGLAAQCPNADVGKIQLTPAWFKSQKCETGNWRISGTGYQFRTEKDPSWEDTIKTTPTAAGTLFEGKLRSSSGGSINGGPEGVSTSVMSDGSFTISRAGWLATSMQTSVSSSGPSVFAGGSGQKNQSRANYYISGNIITLGLPDGRIEHRYANFQVEKGVLEYVHMNGNFYFKD